MQTVLFSNVACRKFAILALKGLIWLYFVLELLGWDLIMVIFSLPEINLYLSSHWIWACFFLYKQKSAKILNNGPSVSFSCSSITVTDLGPFPNDSYLGTAGNICWRLCAAALFSLLPQISSAAVQLQQRDDDKDKGTETFAVSEPFSRPSLPFKSEAFRLGTRFISSPSYRCIQVNVWKTFTVGSFSQICRTTWVFIWIFSVSCFAYVAFFSSSPLSKVFIVL